MNSMSLCMMREAVNALKPNFGRIVERHGNESVHAYTENRLQKRTEIPLYRRDELLLTVKEITSDLFGDEAGVEVAATLSDDWYVSTAEHHAPISHPYGLSATFVQSLRQSRRGSNTILILPCASISLNNSSFPRGLEFHTPILDTERLHFFPWKQHRSPVYGLLPATESDFLHLEQEIAATGNVRLSNFFSGMKQRFLAARSYADQISIFNEAFWRHLPGQEKMRLVYLPQETLVVELLERFHIDESTLLHELLFNPAWQDAFTRHFDGLTGAFHSATGHGTWYFWGLKNGLRLEMIRQGGELVSRDGTYRVTLTPEALRLALERHELMPSMALSFIVLSFYYGLTCGGGFSQVDYLPRLQTAYGAMLADLGISELGALQVQTDFLTYDYAFLSLQTKDRQVMATGLDMFLYNSPETYQRIVHLAQTTSLGQALDNLLPELYAIVKGKSAMLPYIATTQPSCLYV